MTDIIWNGTHIVCPRGGTPPGVSYILHFILYQSSIISHQSSIINHQSSMINDQSIVSTHQSSIFSRHAVITFFLTCMRFFLVDMYALLSWHALFSRHSVVTFFSTLGDQFFLNMQRRGNRLGTFRHHRRPSGRIGKGREASVNPWELSGSIGNLHFDKFFTRFRHQLGQIWSYRGIHSTNRCEISRSFIWKGSWGLILALLAAVAANMFS